jgi:hypothetical protein
LNASRSNTPFGSNLVFANNKLNFDLSLLKNDINYVAHLVKDFGGLYMTDVGFHTVNLLNELILFRDGVYTISGHNLSNNNNNAMFSVLADPL